MFSIVFKLESPFYVSIQVIFQRVWIGCFGAFVTLRCNGEKGQVLHCEQLVVRPMWRNWQTRQTQNLVSVRMCGFDPLRRHH